MTSTLTPACEDELAEIVSRAASDGGKLLIAGGGSKAGIGAPVTAQPLCMKRFSGVVDYDPAEMVLTVRAGTPLREILDLVESEGQMLAFEPFDHGPIFGRPSGDATIGGVVAAGVAGSQRVSMGSVRDHLLGFRAVSGRGEVFRAGGKVVKNVTGYDLPKLAAGSWGRLFALTELTLKVIPRPRMTATRVIEGLDEQAALRSMSAAMGSQADVAAAAYIPGNLRNGRSLTAFRIQGFGPSVAARCTVLETLLGGGPGIVASPSDEEAGRIWSDLRDLAPLGSGRPIWRINVPPSAMCSVVTALERLGADWLCDWAGGMILLAFEGDPVAVREAAARGGGHAMLLRADASQRSSIPAFHPLQPGVAALETRIRRAFDPAGVFETGRF